jgi:hypothetical protein
VCFLSYTCEGKASDKSMAELAGYTLPPGSCLYQDKGFQGFYLPGITIFQPKKTPRGGELTPPEKATNRRISSMGKSKTRGKAVLHTTFEAQRDRDHISGQTHSSDVGD